MRPLVESPSTRSETGATEEEQTKQPALFETGQTRRLMLFETEQTRQATLFGTATDQTTTSTSYPWSSSVVTSAAA